MKANTAAAMISTISSEPDACLREFLLLLRVLPLLGHYLGGIKELPSNLDLAGDELTRGVGLYRNAGVGFEPMRR